MPPSPPLRLLRIRVPGGWLVGANVTCRTFVPDVEPAWVRQGGKEPSHGGARSGPSPANENAPDSLRRHRQHLLDRVRGANPKVLEVLAAFFSDEVLDGEFAPLFSGYVRACIGRSSAEQLTNVEELLEQLTNHHAA